MFGRRHVAVLLIAFAALSALPPLALADGMILRRGGQHVREAEQRAYIDWQDGQESLYVATTAEAVAEPTVWIVPVPASPQQTRAHAVKEFPRLTPGRNIANRAKVDLQLAALVYSLPDTGYLSCCVILPQMRFSKSSKKKGDDFDIHYRDEHFGLVVELVTAKSLDGLDRYLAARALGVKAGAVTALAPYLGSDYTLVCSWRSGAEDEPVGRAVRIDFPCERLFFPLQASRLNETAIDTSVVVRGWVRPSWEQPPGVQCHYVRGSIGGDQPKTSTQGDYTIVRVASQPSTWTKDLWLEQRPPAAIAIAAMVVDHGEQLSLEGLVAISAGVGVFLGLPMAPLCRRRHCRWWDYLLCGGAGGTIVLAVYFTLAWFLLWLYAVACWTNFATYNAGSLWWMTRLGFVAGFVIAHFTLLVIGPLILASWIGSYE